MSLGFLGNDLQNFFFICSFNFFSLQLKTKFFVWLKAIGSYNFKGAAFYWQLHAVIFCLFLRY